MKQDCGKKPALFNSTVKDECNGKEIPTVKINAHCHYNIGRTMQVPKLQVLLTLPLLFNASPPLTIAKSENLIFFYYKFQVGQF